MVDPQHKTSGQQFNNPEGRGSTMQKDRRIIAELSVLPQTTGS
jgi:hypothetical protein